MPALGQAHFEEVRRVNAPAGEYVGMEVGEELEGVEGHGLNVLDTSVFKSKIEARR